MNPIIFNSIQDLILYSIILFAVGFIVGLIVVTYIAKAINGNDKRIKNL